MPKRRALKSSDKSKDSKKTKGGSDIEIPVVFASGAQMVPDEVLTETDAKLELSFDRGLSEAAFKLTVNFGVAITRASLNCALTGDVGDEITELAGADIIPAAGVDVDGTLVEGVLTSADLLPCLGMDSPTTTNIAFLYDEIRTGLIYLNVTSRANPLGEVRGQIFVDL